MQNLIGTWIAAVTTLANANTCFCYFHHLVSFPSCGCLLIVLSQPCFLTQFQVVFPVSVFCPQKDCIGIAGQLQTGMTSTTMPQDAANYLAVWLLYSDWLGIINLPGISDSNVFVGCCHVCGCFLMCVLCCAYRWLLCMQAFTDLAFHLQYRRISSYLSKH